MRGRAAPWLLVGPALLLFIGIVLVPIAMTVLLSFHRWGQFTGIETVVVLDNWQEVIEDPYFAEMFLRTFRIAILVTLAAVLIGAPEAAGDPRFASDESRTAHEPDLKRLIESWSRRLTTEEAVAALAGAGLPAAPIWDIAQAAGNEHARTRGLVSRLPHPVLGLAPTVGQPVRFDAEKPVAETSAPRLGGDRAAILRAFGLEETA